MRENVVNGGKKLRETDVKKRYEDKEEREEENKRKARQKETVNH